MRKDSPSRPVDLLGFDMRDPNAMYQYYVDTGGYPASDFNVNAPAGEGHVIHRPANC